MAISNPTLVEEIKQLTVEEQLALLETISRLIRGSLHPKAVTADSVSKLRGILKPEGVLPTDEELSDAHTDYLIEKYT